MGTLARGFGATVREDHYYDGWLRVSYRGRIGFLQRSNCRVIRIKKQAGKKYVALTFDDGPNKTNTQKVLAALKKTGARATFFQIGRSIGGSHAGLEKQIISQGCEIGTHSWDHANFRRLSQAHALKNLSNGAARIKSTSGYSPHLARIPGGASTKAINAAAGQGGYSVIHWSIDTRDWKTRDTKRTVRAATTGVRDGDIILMHDVYAATANAVEPIVKKLKAQGFEVVTVSELFTLKGVTFTPGKVYKRVK